MKRAVLTGANDPNAHAQLISDLLARNKLSAAETASRKAVKKFPDHVPLHLLRAQILGQSGKFQPARHLLQKLVTRTPDIAPAYTLLGIIDSEQGLDDDAIANFETALRLAPNDCQASYFAASLYLKAMADDKAERALKRTLEISPDHVDALKNLGELMVKTNRYEDAVGYLRRAMSLTRIDDQSAVCLILAETIGNDLATGLEAARHLYAMHPESIGVREAYVFALIRCGELEAAIRLCDEIIAEARNPTTAIAYKASALAESGHEERASELLAMDRFVAEEVLPLPDGWDSIETFNEALVSEICNHETLADHAANRSLKNASDTLELFTGDETGAIKGLREAIHASVETYIPAIAEEEGHPFPEAVPSDFRLEAWANVYPRSGRQLSHFHPEAWLSGVYYPKMPANLPVNDAGAQEGALELGRSYYRLKMSNDVATREILPAPGTLVMFPAFTGHCTVPITSTDETRISVAFNIVPA
ncbi:MAG: tetratricopeptide repeat protein [Rhodospirillales bacterium]|nr:tetratricopeptide repeat protein [Rhodospirillales bacterium]MBO6788509.1 tetratricopeptide repeat protein [Rhodospirillales bacterium]